MPSFTVLAVLAAALALAVHVGNDLAPLDTLFPAAEVDHAVEQHFSATYYDARALFRARAAAAQEKNARVKVLALPLPGYAHLDLTIDVVVVEGAGERAVLHISGTHGVEGFAGSAIQSAFLESLAKGESHEGEEASPTLLVVHALNPYGFSQLRRFNENNVDLNRNFLWAEDFARLQAQDADAFGYEQLREALNPRTPADWKTWLGTWYGMLHTIATKGFTRGKRAVVAGNYHYPETVYYGGDRQQPSVELLLAVLAEQLDLTALKSIGVIDVHTGLGAPGHDTILLSVSGDPEAAQRAREIFVQHKVAAVGDLDGDAAEGYDTVSGLMCDGLARFLPANVTSTCGMQEFGTAPGVFVLLASVQENAMFQHGSPAARIPYAQRLRDVFYFHRSAQWKADVLQRGLHAFRQLVAAHTA